MRYHRGDDDTKRIRHFLRDVLRANHGRELSWQTYRFDYWRWHGIENLGHGRLDRDVLIWETPDSQITAVLNREAPGNVHRQVLPEQRTGALDEEMVAAAEEHLFTPRSDGGRMVRMWVDSADSQFQRLLRHRGYVKDGRAEHQRRRSLAEPVADVPLAPGYTVRALADETELPARSLASWRAFHPDEPAEGHEGWEWYRNIQRAPLYRRELDLVAVAPDGEIAAFCTIWFDDVVGTGAFEPVGTVPAHQRRGLGKAVMTEGLRRLARLGARMAYVGSYSPPAHALYVSMGFTDYDVSESWTKEWQTTTRRR
jgi:ribosomal protein S18 acetylase RimI-like enzyme